MNVTEFVAEIYGEFGFSKAESRRILDFCLDTIRQELSQGGAVKIRNFGSFRRIETKSRKNVPKFYASSNFFKGFEK
jgi:nucleoid DNA-binding protein